ncbi:MAG: hypothetical protein Q8M76_16170 [Spirochaetaceae bacterium]|nr:hypothetical protein [Spirochaetaceae bacterium]
MSKTETSILESKTPEDYIDRSLKARISPAAKAKLARQWMESTGYTKEDILRARNRHPYWKQKKMEGSAERTRRRLSAHDYSGGGSVSWNESLVSEFLGMNDKGPDGRYKLKDWQLAEHFGATIPSIQYMRRKLSKVSQLLGPRVSGPKLIEYLLRAESVLARGKGAVEELKATEKKRAVDEKKAIAAEGKRTAAAQKSAAKELRKTNAKAVPKKAPAKAAPKKPVAKAAPKKAEATKPALKKAVKPAAKAAPKKGKRG